MTTGGRKKKKVQTSLGNTLMIVNSDVEEASYCDRVIRRSLFSFSDCTESLQRLHRLHLQRSFHNTGVIVFQCLPYKKLPLKPPPEIQRLMLELELIDEQRRCQRSCSARPLGFHCLCRSSTQLLGRRTPGYGVGSNLQVM